MNTLSAFAMGQANKGKEQMVFDWDKAAKLIKKNKPKRASAGLAGDWEWTGGDIYQHGKPIKSDYIYLSSNWATPELDLDGKIIDCYIMESKTKWHSDTKWPLSAKKILKQ